MNSKNLSRFTQPVIDLLLKRTAVYSDELRGVEQVKSSKAFRYTSKLPANIDCLILGKEHYSESSQSYPIQSLKEVRNIISLEAQGDERMLMYVIGAYVDGKRHVVSWRISRSVFADKQLKPFFVIPESALLLAKKGNELLTIERGGRTYWFTRRQDEYISAQKKGLIANEMMFLASAGLSEQTEKLALSDDDYLGRMFKSLPQVLITQWQGLKAPTKGLAEIDWLTHFKFSGVAGVVVIAGYLGLSSLYLNIRLESVKGQSSELAVQTKDVFSLQADFNQMQDKYAGFAQVANVQTSSNVVWRLVGPLIKQGVKVERVSLLPDGIYIIDLEAKSATEVLNFVSKDTGIVEAKIRGETSSSGDKEQFAISFRAASEDIAQGEEA